MFKSSRQRRSYFKNRRTRSIAFACFISVVLSCSHQSNKALQNNLKIKFNDLLCLSAQGKGRLRGPLNKVIFSYESEFDQTKLYRIYFDFQLHGEESLILTRRLKWRGSLFQKLFYMNNKNSKIEIKEFYQHLGLFFQKVKKNDLDSLVKIDSDKFVYGLGEFSVTGYLVRGRYRKLRIAYKKKYLGNKYQLDLIASSCQ